MPAACCRPLLQVSVTVQSGITAKKDTHLTDSTSALVDDVTSNQFNPTLESTVDSDLLLGYESARVTYENGEAKAKTQVVGFTTDGSYTDTNATVNNRTVAYVVTAVDKFLNHSRNMTLLPVKISRAVGHPGPGDRGSSSWSADEEKTSSVQDDAGNAQTLPDSGSTPETADGGETQNSPFGRVLGILALAVVAAGAGIVVLLRRHSGVVPPGMSRKLS